MGRLHPFQYFTAHDDAELGAKVSDGRRKEFAAFGWDPSGIPDPQAAETFERSRLNWAEAAAAEHAGILEWYRALLKLRRTRQSLRDGRYQHTFITVDEEERHLVIRRGAIVIACNLGERPQALQVPGATELLLASEPEVSLHDSMVMLPPESIAFLAVSGS